MLSSTLSNVAPTKKSTRHQTRRSARQLALQILFQDEFQQTNPDSLSEFWAGQEASAEVQTFAEQIIEGVQRHQEELDRLINKYAREWTLNRMPVVDRNILRCALFELLWLPDVPAKVIINEALELTKRFADEESTRFVNGILDRVIQDDSRLDAKRADMSTPQKPPSTAEDSVPTSRPEM